MRWLLTTLPAVLERHRKHGAALIAVGLSLLLANANWPAVPVVTGFALIALGATLELVRRFRGSTASPAVLVANLYVYLTLYLLFAGAMLHVGFAKPGGLRVLHSLDLAMSFVPMIAATRSALVAIAGDEDVPAC
jgi:hypothetical protein